MYLRAILAYVDREKLSSFLGAVVRSINFAGFQSVLSVVSILIRAFSAYCHGRQIEKITNLAKILPKVCDQFKKIWLNLVTDFQNPDEALIK